ncbi:MAG: D-alanyl-D-alanine carboxypeptidase [Lachnospiraceae bacterium]|nr:D-alanyl-D-alanine carboxypeptidase [Lachnospiraceae bacterium]
MKFIINSQRMRKSAFASGIFSLFLCATLSMCAVMPVSADTSETIDAAKQARRELPIDSNAYTAWPTGPTISAKAAVLMDANSGCILYNKNMDERMYPASTTKMLTCLIAAEKCQLDEPVTITRTAVESVPSDGSSIGSNPGNVLPMNECLYAILVASANEVASSVAEHIAGSTEAFADMMNAKAKELGCTNTHFVNANGLYASNHYTSAHDLALIAKAFFENDTLLRVGNVGTHHFASTATQPQDFYKTNKHKLITGEISYEGIIGGKTGYTAEAGQTLVTGCDRGDMRLICVVMFEDTPDQFYDTTTLFDYGYQNFNLESAAKLDNTYSIGNGNFFLTGREIFDHSNAILSFAPGSDIILPNMASIEDLESTISFTGEKTGHVADISYSFYGHSVGVVPLITADKVPPAPSVSVTTPVVTTDSDTEEDAEPHYVFINVRSVVFWIIVVGGSMIVLMLFGSMLHSRQDLRHNRYRRRSMKRDLRMKRRMEGRERRRRIRHRY